MKPISRKTKRSVSRQTFHFKYRLNCTSSPFTAPLVGPITHACVIYRASDVAAIVIQHMCKARRGEGK
jgi:hypothetical protein